MASSDYNETIFASQKLRPSVYTHCGRLDKLEKKNPPCDRLLQRFIGPQSSGGGVNAEEALKEREDDLMGFLIL